MVRKLIFPEHGDPDFAAKLASLREYQMYAIPKTPVLKDVAEFESRVQASCFTFEKSLYQHLVAHYMSHRSPYKSVILYHGLGTGKTCSAITIAESLLLDHTQNEEPRVLVVASEVLQKSFEEQVFNYTKLAFTSQEDIEKQCNGDLYLRLVHGAKAPVAVDIDVLRRRIQSLIKSRYRFITYKGLVDYLKAKGTVNDKVIIIDEAHNLRINETEKAAADALERIIETGKRNKVVLLTATPMYNEPAEIFWLLSLLLKNDSVKLPFNPKKPPVIFNADGIANPAAIAMIRQLASEYISYIRSANPFTFGVRLSPADNGIVCLNKDWMHGLGKEIDCIVWSAPANAPALPADAGDAADAADEDAPAPAREKGEMMQLQYSNIKFVGKIGGAKGFKTVFNVLEEPGAAAGAAAAVKTDTLRVAYKKGFENYLSLENAATVAPKMKKIAEFVATSEGIIVIYSQFIWAGVFPMAIVLEQLGFRRYSPGGGGASSTMLHPAPKVAQPVRYDGVPFPSYCILGAGTSSTNIDKMLKVINSPANIHGENIKVVLMTPVAGEGLSFRNVREVHILDPWYHMNRLEQVIGRAIRTCSHTDLPIEERNITVFMHASTLADIHAYKISARKLGQTQLIEQTIRDSALDCSLLKNINFYPKSAFDFQIVMRTSQKKLVPYTFGDDDEIMPKCTAAAPHGHHAQDAADAEITRSEVSETLLTTTLKRMKKYIIQHMQKSSYFEIEDVVKAIATLREVALKTIYRGIYPHHLIKDHMIYPHLGRLVIVKDTPRETPISLYLPHIARNEEAIAEESNQVDDILNIIETTGSENTAIISAYTSIDSGVWFDLAKHLIKTGDSAAAAADAAKVATAATVADIFGHTGALVAKKELPRLNRSRHKYVGFVNIFNTKEFEVVLYDEAKNNYVKATESEVQQIKSRRQEVAKPTGGTDMYGILEPHRLNKAKTAPFRFTFKIIIPESGKLGEICTSKKYKQLDDIMGKLGIVKAEKKTKDQYCYTIMNTLLEQKKLYMYPQWKP